MTEVRVQPFAYPESPWHENATGFSAGLADLSAEIQRNCGDGAADGLAWTSSSGVTGRDGGAVQSSGAVQPGVAEETAFPAMDRIEIQAEIRAQVETASREAEDRGFSQGMAAGLVAGRDEAALAIRAERERLLAQGTALTESLDAARAGYFREVERETARLALLIAGRILRRELQMDPLLLTGAVRVALGQLAAATQVRLRVPARDREMWAEALALIPRLEPRPQVIGDEQMEPGDCRMETELGSVDLGLWPQLREIERGILDGASNMAAKSDRSVANRFSVDGLATDEFATDPVPAGMPSACSPSLEMEGAYR